MAAVHSEGFYPIVDPEPTEADLRAHWPDFNCSDRMTAKEREEALRRFAYGRWQLAMQKENPDAFLVPFVEDLKNYSAYLKSSEWARIRKHVLDLYDGACACCDATATAVHLRDYRPRVLRGEDMNALVPVCISCYDLIETTRKGPGGWQAGERLLADLLNRTRLARAFAA